MSPETQARMLAETAGVRLRDDLCQLQLSGDDQRSWLSGQVTGDLSGLCPGASVYCLAVNVRGKIMADVWVLDDGERLSLLVPSASRELLLESFEGQIIMEDVEVETVENARVVSVQGPLAAQVVEDAGVASHDGDELGHGGRVVLTRSGDDVDALLLRLSRAAEAVGGGPVDEAGFELARLRARRPRFGRDFDLRHYPQEAGLKERAVSFNKGCYLGQEVVCTLENRGRLSRALVVLVSSEALPPGTPLLDAEGETVGEVTSCAEDAERGAHLALGYVKRAHANAGEVLRGEAAEVRIEGRVGDAA